LRFVAAEVSAEAIVSSWHWLMEERPAATIAAIQAFLEKK
jgi:hypothetical protein